MDEVKTMVHSFIAEADVKKAKELALEFEQIIKDETRYSNTGKRPVWLT